MLSVAIPTYEMGNMGSLYLRESFEKFLNQKKSNFEIVISDHSQNSEIENLCVEFSNFLNIKYVKFNEKFGNFSANLNNAINNCSGKYIKLLMQDDYLIDEECLYKTELFFDENPNFKWLACGCKFGQNGEHQFSMFPYYSDEIKQVKNTIGSPTVISFINNNAVRFNENFQWVTDLDFYVKMFNEFGDMGIIQEHLVYIRMHQNQITNTMNAEAKLNEENHFKQQF